MRLRPGTLSDDEIEVLLAWDRVARYFRRCYGKTSVSFKDIAFREVYGELIRTVVQERAADRPYVLLTDLWNEGIEVERNLTSFVDEACNEVTLVGMDVSRYVCEFAKEAGNKNIEIVRATMLAFPFQPKFDFIIDASTVDHVPDRLRGKWVSSESSLLREKGILLISFDCRLNLFTELFHKLITRKLYPEWTLLPSNVKVQLEERGFKILREHATFIVGLFLGTHRPWFPFGRLLRRKGIFTFLKRVELSKRSPLLCFLAPQHAIVAEKTATQL